MVDRNLTDPHRGKKGGTRDEHSDPNRSGRINVSEHVA